MILKECFADEYITSHAGNNIDKKRIYEKIVHAFYLLEKLANTGLARKIVNNTPLAAHASTIIANITSVNGGSPLVTQPSFIE